MVAPHIRHARPVVVGFGEVLWDVFHTGRRLGGSPANFSWHARQLGARSIVVSRVGRDPAGRDLLVDLRRRGLATDHISRDPDRPTGAVSICLMAAGIPRFTIHKQSAWDTIPWSSTLGPLASSAASVCFGSLAQRAPVSRRTLRQFLLSTRFDCLRVFDVNLRPPYINRAVVTASLELCTLCKLNETELSVIGKLLGLGSRPDAILSALFKRFPLQWIAVTRGRRGSVLQTRQARSEHPGFAVRVEDTVGAGDAFTAALVMGALRGDSLDRMNARANRVAAFVCTQSGATPPLPRRLTALFCRNAGQ